MAIEEEEMLEEIQVVAQRKHGKPFALLTEEEKEAIYRDYVGERDVANAEFAQGDELINQPAAEMIQTGDLHHANWGGALGNALKAGAGAYKQHKAKGDLEDLSDSYQKGSQAAGQVAAHQQQQNMNLLQSILTNRQAGANPQPSAGTTTTTPQPGGGQGGPAQQPANMPPMMGAAGPAGPGGAGPAAPPMPQGMPPQPGTPGAPPPKAPPPAATPQGLQGMNSITGMPIGGGAPPAPTGPGANKPPMPMTDIPAEILEKLKFEEMMKMLRGG